MFLLKTRLISRILPNTAQRSLSFLDRFCKKDNNESNSADDGEGDKITVELDNAFKLYNLDTEPRSTIVLTKKNALKMYNDMQTIRKMENICANLYREKIIRGFCHLYVGQEACAVGIKSAMRPQDSIITSYRSHGWTWIMGVSLHGILAELCQKQTGCSRGKGGSMHTFAPNFYGGNGIVGAQTSLGAGIAFAHAYRCNDGVNFACYGDGAANQGQLHEVFNMSCLWKLPVVFVCENNQYGMGTASKRSSFSTDYYTRGDYMPGLWVNGNDILAVQSAAEFAIHFVRTFGPLVVELETYRYHGHSMSDPGTSYRKREEVQIMRQKFDPITTFKDLCMKNDLVKEEEFRKIDDIIKTEIDNAVKQVRQDKDPELNEMTADVYANNLEGNIRGILNRDLKHIRVGIPLVPWGTPKVTPKSEIKELPTELVKKNNKEKERERENKKEDSKEDSKEDPKGDSKTDIENKESDDKNSVNDKLTKVELVDFIAGIARQPITNSVTKPPDRDKDNKPEEPKKK